MEKFEAASDILQNPDKLLEQRLHKREKVEILGQEIELLDYTPENLKTQIPTLIATAFAVRPAVYELNAKILAKAGRRVLAIDAPHGIETGATGEHPLAELRKVAAIMEMLNAKGIEKIDVMAQSEGALYTVIAASLHPDRFRNLVLVDPAGIIGDDSVIRLAKGALADSSLEAERRKTKTDRDLIDGPDFIKTILSRPYRSLAEVLAISAADLREMLVLLKEKGVGISVVHAVDDKLFPGERVQVKRNEGESEKDYQTRMKEVYESDAQTMLDMRDRGEFASTLNSSMVDGFYSVQGTHNELIQRPELYTTVVESALSALEKRPTRD